MILSRSRIALFALAVCTVAASAQTPEVLKNLRPAHPRLILLDSDIPAIKATIASDPFAAANFAELKHEGDDMLSKPVHPYKIDGPEHDMLNTARHLEEFIITLSALYRFTGDRKYADRATLEMLNAAAFQDWFPTHFLDDAEITAALALGYDWLYPILTSDQRKTIKEAIATKGLDAFIDATKPVSAIDPTMPRFKYHNNWVQVCYGGETLGALAIGDEEPRRANTIITRSQAAMRDIMQLFAPDGGFEEGPTYWAYATSYNVMYLAALQSAIGTDFGLSKMPGFAETGAYRIQAQGPFFDGADFGDSHEGIFRAPQMFWMATQFHKSEYTVMERRLDQAYAAAPPEQRMAGEAQRFLAFSLIYYKPDTAAAKLQTVQHFDRTGQAFIRSSWALPTGAIDTDAWYIALKGGAAKASHGHLDLGAFILDAFGERWAMDLGAETYGVPNYFGKLRWTYFRTSTMGHNTLTLDNSNEDTDAVTAISALGQDAAGKSKYAVLNLDSAYKEKLSTWHRGVDLINNNQLVVQDELTPKGKSDITWNLFTHAQFKPGKTAREGVLELHGKKMHLRILAPADASFETPPMPTLPPPQNSVAGITNVCIHLHNIAKPETISILFEADDADVLPAITPLAKWTTPSR